MNSERWRQIDQLVQEVLDQSLAERLAVIDRTCAGDESLRSEVVSLLSSCDAAPGFLADPPSEVLCELAVREADLLPGQNLGSYQITALIGRGGTSAVYRARHSKLGRLVAIKVLPVEFSGNPHWLLRFEREAQAASSINHPNILSVYDIDVENGTPYIVAELLEGITLRERLAEGPLAEPRAIDYALQVALGLAAAHDKGIIHRDLKPENLFITEDGLVKILDFGLAKQMEVAGLNAATAAENSLGPILGTTAYMSPEQVKGEPVDPRADVFALGSVLYEMLTGKLAFRRKSAAETISAILGETPPDMQGDRRRISPALQRIVFRCLEKDARRRFQSAEDLAFALDCLCAGTAKSPTRAASAGKTNWWPTATLVIAFLFLISARQTLRRVAKSADGHE